LSSSKYPNATLNFSSNSAFLCFIYEDFMLRSTNCFELAEDERMSSTEWFEKFSGLLGMLFMRWGAGYCNFLPWMVSCLLNLWALGGKLRFIFFTYYPGWVGAVSTLIFLSIICWTSTGSGFEYLGFSGLFSGLNVDGGTCSDNCDWSVRSVVLFFRSNDFVENRLKYVHLWLEESGLFAFGVLNCTVSSFDKFI